MSYSWIIRIVGIVVLVVGLALLGYFAYTAGLAQGQTAAPAVVESGETAVGHGVWGRHPFFGLAIFPGLLCLAPFFLCLFIFFPLRMIFGPHRAHMYLHGKWFGEGHDVPPPVEEWHRRMHEDKKPGG